MYNRWNVSLLVLFPRVRRMSALAVAVALAAAGCAPRPADVPAWEAANPVKPLPTPPLGADVSFDQLKTPPTPERVRLGRWLFYDTRLSADGTVSCATCHQPEHAFSQPTAVSTGIRGQKGTRKAPTFINEAASLFPHFFWDGRAASLEDQALGPVANPIEMGNTHEAMVSSIRAVPGYAKYFLEAFGTNEISKERIAQAIADYERTRLSGNSPYDRWRRLRDPEAVSAQVKLGHELFFGKAACVQCHVGSRFTDNSFHNIGIGWNEKTKTFSDEGRYTITKGTIDEKFGDSDRGAFKTPTLREVSKRAPYMHDGSVATLREVVEYYNRGGNRNPYMDLKMPVNPLGLTEAEIDALVAMMNALEGEGYADTAPASFPK
jgi:cytochrome c peroxidase